MKPADLVVSNLRKAMEQRFETLAAQPVGPVTNTVAEKHSVLSALAKQLSELPDEPFGQFMRDSGYPPETHDLVLPAAKYDGYQKGVELKLPTYVLRSEMIDKPCFILRGAV